MMIQAVRTKLAAVLDIDPEAWSKLKGLLAQLDLPPTTPSKADPDYRRFVEIQTADGWVEVERYENGAEEITFLFGLNGSTRRFSFPYHLPPQWRVSTT